jgi:hypothetical protein
MTPPSPDERLYRLMPHAVSTDTLQEYGIDWTPEQCRHLTVHLLSINLYWIRSALEAHLARQDATSIFSALQRRIETGWESDFDLRGWDPHLWWSRFEENRTGYDRAMRERNEPVSVALEAIDALESDGTMHAEDRPKLLALLIDLVPVEEYGELAGELT